MVLHVTKEVGDKTSAEELEMKSIIFEIKKEEKLDLKLHLLENKIPFLKLKLHETFQ